jgi:hypothetical protein
MKQKTGIFPLAVSVVAAGLLLSANTTQAVEVILDQNNNVTQITDLNLVINEGVTPVDVTFVSDTGFNIYGGDILNFQFTNQDDSVAALLQVMDALNANVPVPVGAGPNGTDQFYIGADEENDLIVAAGGENFGGVWDRCETDCVEGVAVLNPLTPFTYAVFGPASGGGGTGVDLTGTVQDEGGTPLCSLTLASGQFMFTCDPNGPYELLDLPTESDGTVKRQVYVDGFFPNVKTLTNWTNETVVMTRATNCPDYNSFPDPSVNPGSAGNRIDVSGTVLLQNTQTAVCAMVLGNGQFGFTCDGTGTYAANIPLDDNGQYKLQVYADGFAPMVQRFDEFTPNVEVRLARAAECQ